MNLAALQRIMLNAELNIAQNHADIYNALIDIYKSVGGGWIAEAEALTEPDVDSFVSEAVDRVWQRYLERK